jgi:hypothetical protein
MVWPLPRFVFVNDKAVNLIREENLTGVRIIETPQIDIFADKISPGRLSKWMPVARARALGQRLGIE